MAPISQTLHKLAVTASAEMLATFGPSLTRIRPIRQAAVKAAENLVMNDLREVRSSRRVLPRAYEDQAVMGLALIRTVERGMAERHMSRAALRKAARVLVRSILVERGDREAVDRFREQYGTDPPAFLSISPGKACNLKCIGCYADSGANRQKLDWDTFDRIITEAKTLWGARFFVITGGEPLAYHSDGKGILDAAEKHDDCFFMMYTNGTLINDRMARRLAQLGNLTPAISMEGWRERTDARRGPGIFDQVVAAHNRLRQAGVPFGVSLTATCQNCEELLSEEFMDFCFEEQGALYGWIFQYMPIGRSFTLDLLPTPEQRAWMWQRSWEIVRERRILLADFWNHGTATDGCIAAGRWTGGGYMYIDWNGSVNPCVFVPYSAVNIKQVYAEGKNLSEAWAHPFFADIRQWQQGYTEKQGNWMMPCINRDHHTRFYRMLTDHEPEPADENAAAALLDPEYHLGLDAYDKAYEALVQPVWDDYYVQGDGRQEDGLTPLPRFFKKADPPSEE